MFNNKKAVQTGLTAFALCAGLATSAQAASFTTNYTGSGPKGDIWLDSIELNGKLITDFSFVTGGNINQNDRWTGGNSGAASADIGDNATTGVKEEDLSEASLLTNLGNNNLNNIIDTEDSGKFEIDLSFDKALDNILLWERGMNSKIGVQALDTAGNLIGNFLELNSKNWDYAGYKLNTKEIGGTQKVGSLAVSLADLGLTDAISSIRVTSKGSSYKGPDWKLVGTAAAVPEPGAVAGLVALGLLGTIAKRKHSAKNA
ncbi:MAG: exosortase-dependent surface protein XDP2 [Spirulinaceae cyanobacterium]